MKKLLAILISVFLIFSLCFISVSAAEHDAAFKEAFDDLYWIYYGNGTDEYYYTESQGPSAEFVDEFLWFSQELEQYAPSYDVEEFFVNEEEYERHAFKYFDRSDKLLNDLHSLDTYSSVNRQYKTTFLAVGGPSVGFKYDSYKFIGNYRYEVYSYIYWKYDNEPDSLEPGNDYTPPADAVEGKDYVTLHYNWSPEQTLYGKVIGGIKSIVSYDSFSAPKYLSIEKLSKEELINILYPTSDTPEGSSSSSTEDASTPEGSVSNPEGSDTDNTSSQPSDTTEGSTTSSQTPNGTSSTESATVPDDSTSKNSNTDIATPQPDETTNENTSSPQTPDANGTSSAGNNTNGGGNPTSTSPEDSQSENQQSDSSDTPDDEGNQNISSGESAQDDKNNITSSNSTSSGSQKQSNKGNKGIIPIIIVITAVILISGAAAIYFFVLKPRNIATNTDFEIEEPPIEEEQ